MVDDIGLKAQTKLLGSFQIQQSSGRLKTLKERYEFPFQKYFPKSNLVLANRQLNWWPSHSQFLVCNCVKHYDKHLFNKHFIKGNEKENILFFFGYFAVEQNSWNFCVTGL